MNETVSLIHIPNLPDKLSDLLEVTAKDLRKAVSDGCIVQMDGVWHLANDEGCHVCFAGALMRRGVPDGQTCDPDWFDDDTRRKLGLLNALRAGAFGSAFCMLRNPPVAGPASILRKLWYLRKAVRDKVGESYPYEYAAAPAFFFQDIEEMIQELREIGL